MILLGQLPWLGVYVEMYVSVLKEFIKVFSAYVWLLIGYALSFFIIFNNERAFSNPLKALWKTLAMMTGELEYSELFSVDSDSMVIVSDSTVRLIIVAFLVTVTIVLMNLLVGIVVHDVSEIKSRALVTKLEQQVVLVQFMSTTIANDKFILNVVVDFIKNLPNYIRAKTPTNIRPTQDTNIFTRGYISKKNGNFTHAAEKAAFQIALVNQEMRSLDMSGDSVDGPMNIQSYVSLENRSRKNHLKIKQLLTELFAIATDNEEILVTLKSRKCKKSGTTLI